MDLQDLFDIPPYSLNKSDKSELFGLHLNALTQHHYQHCWQYMRMVDGLGMDPQTPHPAEELPFLPTRLFKMMELSSVPKDQVFKTMTSSGTSGQAVSKIYLDKETAQRQSRALTKIVSSLLGSKRCPMLIIDSESVVKDRLMFSARGAGILGFSMFGSKREYALDDQMQLKIDPVVDFLNAHKDERIFLFGFTFMIYQHFMKALKENHVHLNLSNGVLIHGGGWKKLISGAMTPVAFRKELHQLCGIKSVHDYYGMVEQTGSIFMECEFGHLHASVFSDVIIRRPGDFSIASAGEKGIIQTLSLLPTSYPGHSILTEDEGILAGEDDCPCGRLGKYFTFIGRIENAEIRGCSDTYADRF